MNAIKNWLSKYSISTHTVIVAAAVLAGAYDAVPQFHALVMQLYHALPGWLEQIVTVVLAVYAWYRKGQPKSGPVDGTNVVKLN